ncbi:hypothetical protein [Tortoise microvirus 82]|nr:hypothetical protein [Tortoise microvirus 82]
MLGMLARNQHRKEQPARLLKEITRMETMRDMIKVQAPQAVPERYAEALNFLRNPAFLGSARHQAQHWRAERAGAHADILAFERAFIRRFKRLGVPMFAHCVQRSEATQLRHFAAGTTNARPGQSPHNHGKAVDLVHGIRAWDIPRPAWDLVGHIGKEVARTLGVKVRWGGDFKSLYDPAHWELEDWVHYPIEPVVSDALLDEVLRQWAGTAV